MVCSTDSDNLQVGYETPTQRLQTWKFQKMWQMKHIVMKTQGTRLSSK